MVEVREGEEAGKAESGAMKPWSGVKVQHVLGLPNIDVYNLPGTTWHNCGEGPVDHVQIIDSAQISDASKKNIFCTLDKTL